MTRKSFITLTITHVSVDQNSSIQGQPNDYDYLSSSHQSSLWRRLTGLGLNLSRSSQSRIQYAFRGTGRALALLGASSLWLRETLRGLLGLLLVDWKYWFLSMGQTLLDISFGPYSKCSILESRLLPVPVPTATVSFFDSDYGERLQREWKAFTCSPDTVRLFASACAQIMLILSPPGNTQGLQDFLLLTEMSAHAWHYHYSLVYEVKQNVLPSWRARWVSRLLQWFCTLLRQNRTGHLCGPHGFSLQSSPESASSRLCSVCTWDAKRKHWDTLGADPYSLHSINYGVSWGKP